jgi:dihydrofolate reductase
MSKVFFNVGLSLDGYLAGPNRRHGNPLGDGGVGMHEWMCKTATFLEKIGETGSESSPDDTLVKGVFARAGAYVMGRRMVEEGEVGWPDDPPFHAPVFVLTHSPREPWVRKGGTTFFFVTDGIASALARARAAAASKDVRISGGAQTIRQCIEAGLIDDCTLHVAPVLLGEGIRLFEQLGRDRFAVEQVDASYSPLVTPIRYRVIKRPATNPIDQ